MPVRRGLNYFVFEDFMLSSASAKHLKDGAY